MSKTNRRKLHCRCKECSCHTMEECMKNNHRICGCIMNHNPWPERYGPSGIDFHVEEDRPYGRDS